MTARTIPKTGPDEHLSTRSGLSTNGYRLTTEAAAQLERWEREAAEIRSYTAAMPMFEPWEGEAVELPDDEQAAVAEWLECHQTDTRTATTEDQEEEQSSGGTNIAMVTRGRDWRDFDHLIDPEAPCAVEDSEGVTHQIHRRDGRHRFWRYQCNRSQRCPRHGARNRAIAAAWIVTQTAGTMFRHKVDSRGWDAFRQRLTRARRTLDDDVDIVGVKIPVEVHRDRTETLHVWLSHPVGPAERFDGDELEDALASSLAWRATLKDQVEADIAADIAELQSFGATREEAAQVADRQQPKSRGLGLRSDGKRVTVSLPIFTPQGDWRPSGYVATRPMSLTADAIEAAGWTVEMADEGFEVLDAPPLDSDGWEVFAAVAGLRLPVAVIRAAKDDETPLEAYHRKGAAA